MSSMPTITGALPTSKSVLDVNNSNVLVSDEMTHVVCHIKGVEKVYLSIDTPHNHLSLVFTCAKTREAVNSIFPSEQIPECYVPNTACEENNIYWSVALANFKINEKIFGMGAYVQRLITDIGKRISPKEPARRLPILFFLPSR